MISENFALTTAHCVAKKGTRILFERILLVGGSIFWNKQLDPEAQTQEFPSMNHVFLHDNWFYDFWNGYGKLGIIRYCNNGTQMNNNNGKMSLVRAF